jgi:glutamate dehydrogenase
MPRTDEEQQKADLIATVVRKARRQFKGNRRAAADRFLSQYYRHVPPHDLVGQSPDTLFGAALAHWKLGTTRISGKSAVRVYNPSMKTDGWRSDHTVVEIVTDDMPFLVDSVTAGLNRQGLTVHLIIHPVLKVRRNRAGRLSEVLQAEESGTGVGAESFMHFEVTGQSGERLAEIAASTEAVINDVRAAVEDWRPIRNTMAAIIEELGSPPANVPAEDAAEVREFLRWIHDDHFTFLGFREFLIRGDGERATVSVNRKAGLGILRDPNFQVFRELHDLASMPPDMRAFVSRPELLMVTKTNRKSTVHRPVHMDSIGIKRLDARGKVVSQRMFVGLFTSTAYNWSARDIPLLRRKLHKTCARAGFEPASHDGKALLNILETFPRDELFQISEDQLFHTALGILHLQDRQRVALFLRRDDFERFISCLVYVPRDRYTMALRERAQKILEKAFAGEITSFTTLLGDAPLARVHMIIRTTAGRIPAYDVEKVEAELIEAARSWTDHLSNALIAACGEEKGLTLYRRYEDAFPAGYRDEFDAAEAVADIAVIEETLVSGELGMNLYRPPGGGRQPVAVQGLSSPRGDPPVPNPAHARAYGSDGGGRDSPRHPSPGRRRRQGADSRLRARDPHRRRGEPGRHPRKLSGHLPPCLARGGGERRFQRPGAERRPHPARRGHPQGLLQIPASGGYRVFPGLHGADPGQQPDPDPPDRRPVPGHVRPGAGRRSRGARRPDPQEAGRRPGFGGQRG